ncbi:MAG: M48 family metallopeptidase [Elusimicrobia bacterium]|nr:M48 family metallopeptidase [Candidatus Obscuribacterium magneticum]
MNSAIKPFLLAGLFGLASITGCIRNPATKKVHARLLSAESERRIGLETKKKILEQYQVLESTSVAAYVNRVGQKLAAVSDRPTVDYDFTVLNSDLVNAFAVPGGFIFVTRGLLESIDDEAELAMVLAHEISHVAALHGVQLIQKEMGQNALTILGTIGAAITLGPEAMLMVANTADLFSSLYLLGYSREKESEADDLGLQYMIRAGYDPQASLSFLKELEKQEGDETKGWDLYFRTHPPIQERIQKIESMIGTGPRDIATSYREAYQKMKDLLPKVDFSERGEIRQQTYINNIHRLQLTVPDNWLLGYFQPQSLVSFHTKDNKGEGRLQVVRLSTSITTAEELAYKYAQNEGFQFSNGRDVLYNAGYGYLGRYKGLSSRGEPVEVRLYATLRKGRGYVLICEAPLEKMETYLLDIEQIMRRFRFG